MTTEHQISKVDILIQQKKYAEAERALQDLLAQDPHNPRFLALLAEVYLQQDKPDEANRIIDQAIGLSPDVPYLFYIKARVALQQDKLQEAENHIGESIRLDPYDADYPAMLANIKLARKKYAEALEIANRALEIDPENLLALNTRSTALLKLDRKEESFQTIEGALREDPNNAYTHTNYGWGLLEKGDYKKAKEHFKEALQNDPNSPFAQAGLLEAIKASNPVYRLFLKYAFFMGNLASRYQWAVIIGFYFGMKALRAVARNSPALQPYLTPLIIALALIAFSTWVINPIGNLFLRFNKYGQLLLDRNERMSSNFVAGSFALFVLGMLLYFAGQDDKFLTIAVFGFAMMLPFGVMFSPSKNRYILKIYAAVMAIIGVAAIIGTFSSGEMFNSMTSIFIMAFVLFQLVANYLVIKENN